MIEASKYVYQWRKDISSVARDVFPLTVLSDKSPVAVRLDFTFTRPKSHVTSNGDLRLGFTAEHLQRPDVDKLSRAVLDALTGIAWQDDSQVISLTATKRWGDASGVLVSVSMLQHSH